MKSMNGVINKDTNKLVFHDFCKFGIFNFLAYFAVSIFDLSVGDNNIFRNITLDNSVSMAIDKLLNYYSLVSGL